jgi:cell division protein FtsW
MTPSTDARATKRGETKGRGNKRPNLRLVTNPGDNVGRLKAARAKLTSRELLYLDGLGVLSLAVLLNAFGLVMVLSSSTVASINTAGTPWSLFEKQLMWTAIGAVCCLIAVHMPLYRLRKLSIPLLLVVIVLLGLVFFPEFGSTVGGSSRWIDLGPLQIQPSEFAKLALVLFLSDLAVRRQKVRDEFKAIFIPALLALGLLALLIVKQPDLGTAIVLTCIAASVLFAAGVRRGTLIGVIGSLALIGIVLATDESYRRERFLAFMHPMANASGSGYQLAQSLIALGSGHLTGSGIGGSVAKWNLLPNAWTDFIFAIVGNELGLLGGIAVIVAFGAFAYFGLRIARRTTDRFSSLLAVGITAWIVSQAFINIGGVEGALPETGVPLPFISSGGSSLVVALVAVGLLYNIASNPVQESPSRRVEVPVARAARTAREIRPARAAGATKTTATRKATAARRAMAERKAVAARKAAAPSSAARRAHPSTRQRSGGAADLLPRRSGQARATPKSPVTKSSARVVAR